MPRYESQRALPVVLEIRDEVAELPGVHQGLGLVHPLTLREGLRQLVRDDAADHQVVEAARQLLPHDRAVVARHLHIGPGDHGAQRPHGVVRYVEHGRALHEHLADAVPLHVVVLHVVRGERLHPVDEGGLLDDVDRGVEVEAGAAGRRLEMPQVQIRIRQAVLCPGQHAGVYELVPADLPLAQDGVEVHPVEAPVQEVDVDDDPGDAVQQEAGGPEDRVHEALLAEVRELGPGEVGRLQQLAAPLPQVVEDEVDEVAVDAAGGHREQLLRLAPLALG
mmetsp:Transcript_109184/g.337103  ORF Transcript_109184/g.337103 Transcript_109184/m.337103 type:complete len:278 (+) Transcript_109184:1655-2488(+)